MFSPSWDEKVCWHPVSRPRASCTVRRLTKTLNMWIFNKAACRPARGGSHQNGDQPLAATWTHGDIVPDIYTLLGHWQLTRRRLFIFIQVTTQVKGYFLSGLLPRVSAGLRGGVWCVVWTSVWFLISKLIIFNPKLKTKKFCPEKGYIILDSHSFL